MNPNETLNNIRSAVQASMTKTVDLRILVHIDTDPAELIGDLVAMAGFDGVDVLGVVELCNDGFGRMLPDSEVLERYRGSYSWDGNPR